MIHQRTTGGRRTALEALWNKECKQEEAFSQKRWETNNLKYFKKYDHAFKESYADKNPFVKSDSFTLATEQTG